VNILSKIAFSVFLAAAILSACQSSTLSFSEIENVPRQVEDSIDPNYALQLINNGKKGSYIIFNTSGEIESSVEAQQDTVTIKLDVSDKQNDNSKSNVFLLTTEPEQDVLLVQVNGEIMPFDNITGFE